MAEEVALDLEELRHIQSIAKRPRILNLISSEISNLEKVSFLKSYLSIWFYLLFEFVFFT